MATQPSSPPRTAWAQIETLGAALARRRALAFVPRPEGVRGPAWPRLLGELATPIDHWQAARSEPLPRFHLRRVRARSCCCPASAPIRCG
ncbi:hypothetical protein ACFS32_19175 [Novosphingobium pokkalii]|uniref:hypothetical protein n=1 Tax=Novosphingobium pokkalii TaxID=1770194 RepID=UPI0036297A13